MSKQLEFDVQINTPEITERVSKAVLAAQRVLDSKVLQDSNRYCPLDTSNLQKSGILGTVLGSGKVTWACPYARDQYYTKPNKSKQRNPNASLKWFEVAKSKNKQVWETLANDEFNKHS